MSSRSQQRNSAIDAVTAQCIERISALDQKLTSTNSELVHHKETLQLEIRDKTKDVLNEAKKDLNNLKVNQDIEFASLRNSFNKDNESLTKKMEKKFKEVEELMESRDIENKKYAEKLFNEQQGKIRELNVKIDKEVLELREMIINEVNTITHWVYCNDGY